MADRRPVTLTIPFEAAELFRDGLSDVLCWTQGFAAGIAAAGSSIDGPMSIETLRELNIQLKRAIARAEND